MMPNPPVHAVGATGWASVQESLHQSLGGSLIACGARCRDYPKGVLQRRALAAPSTPQIPQASDGRADRRIFPAKALSHSQPQRAAFESRSGARSPYVLVGHACCVERLSGGRQGSVAFATRRPGAGCPAAQCSCASAALSTSACQACLPPGGRLQRRTCSP